MTEDSNGMLALIFNAGWMELMLVAVIAVLIFGRDLPQVAARAFVQLQKLRRGVQQVWRETGISQEMRNLSRQMEESERKARAPLDQARRVQAELRDQVQRPLSASEPADAAADEAQVPEPNDPQSEASDEPAPEDQPR